MLRAMMIVVSIASVSIAAPATKPAAPATQPADPTDPANYTAADTHGELVGVKLIGKRYNPNTGAVSVRILLGNKGNKVLREIKGEVLQPRSMYVSGSGARSYWKFTLREAIDPGKVGYIDVLVGYLPSETDAEVAAGKDKVAGITAIEYIGDAEFAGGAKRRVGGVDGELP